MKRILGFLFISLFFSLSAKSQEVADSVLNSSGPTRLRLFWKNVGSGKELFGKDNVGNIFRQAPVRSINGRIGVITLNKADVGLSNANNTADINKPISLSTQAALDAKEPTITPGLSTQYWTGSKTWATFDKAAIGLGNLQDLDQTNAANLLSGTIASGRFGSNSIPLSSIAQGGATSGQVISWNGTNWAAATVSGGGGGSGEANTASNVGVGGVGFYKQKTGVNLEFRNVNVASGKLTVTLDAVNNEVDFDIVDANLVIATSQLTGTLPSARFANLTIPPSAISQGGATTNQVLSWNGSAWTGASLGSAAFLNVASSGNAASGEVVKGNDTRLTDSRTPTTHTHAAGDITTGTFSGALFGNATIATTKLSQSGATTGQAILWDGTAWNPGTVSTGSGGEANTASNVNTGGIGVFNGKVGIDLQFKGVAAASTKVSVSNNTTNKTVDVDVVDSNLSIAGSQLTGTIPAARFGATTIPISSFNVTGTASSSTYLRGDGTWTALSGTGEVNTGSNVNTAGVGVYNGKVGADLQFKGVAAGSSKVTITNNTTNKTVDVDIADANLSIAGTQLTGTIPAARMPAYTGDVTTSAGTVANTITNNAVTNAKAAQMAANTIKGNNTGATANAVDMTVSQAKSLLALDLVPNVDATNASNLSSGSIPSGRFGVTTVPISSINATGTASSSTYLRGDGTWNTLSGVGETNTASNVGVGGVGIYKQKTGVNFDLRNINAGSNKIGVTLDAANNEVDIDVNQANLSIATTQLTGTLQAAQFPAQTGDVTNTAGSLANTIGTNVVTNAKSAQMAANTVKMNATGSTANAQDVSAASFKTWLYTALSIPVSAINATGTASSSNFLRGDGTWSAVPSAGWDITSYSLSGLRAASPTAAYVYLTDSGKEGVFAYNASNTTGTDNTGTVIVTANGRRYERVISDKTVNPVWFGATGDGTTNDNTAVVACFAVADGTTINTVFFPAGTYKINVDAVTVQSGVKVIGDNGAKLLAATTPTSQANLLTTTGNNVTIQNLEFTASTFYVRGIKASSGTNIKVQNCRATTATLAEFNSCNVVEVTGCYAKTTQNFGAIGTQSSAWACIHMYFTNYFTVDRNYIDGYGHNIQFWGGDANNYLGVTDVPVPITVAKGIKSGKISNNTSINSGGGCIWGGMAEDILVSNNYCANCADVGIDFEACKNSKAEFNTIKDCGNGNFGMFYYNGQIEWDNNISIVTSSSYHHVIIADIATSVDVGSQIVKFTNNTFESVGHISIIGDAAQIFGSFKYMHVNENIFKNTTWQITTAGHYKEFRRNKMYFDIAANNAALAMGGFTAVNSQPGRCVIEGNEILFRNGGTTAIGIQLFAGEASAVNYATIANNVIIGATIDLNTKFSINSATYIPVIQVNENVFNTNNWVREEPSSGSSANIILRKNKRLDGTPTLLTDIPTSGFWTVGQEAVFYNVTSSGKTGMVNVLAGSPGTWDDLQWTLPANGNSNLLRGGSVTASSNLGGTQWQASNLIDGGRTSGASTYGWSSAAQGSEFVSLTLTMDIGSFKTFNSLYLFPTNDPGYEGAGFPRDFAISTSTDNTTYLSAYSTTGQLQPTNGQPLKINFPVRYARYVKVVITRIYLAEGGSPKAQLRALEIY